MPNLTILAVVAAGGAAGAVIRYLVSYQLIGPVETGAFPWGTFAVNLIGSLLFGIAIVLIGSLYSNDETLRSLALIGVLGAFTTFSTFSFESWQLFSHGYNQLALTYIGASVVTCILAVAAGAACTKYFVH